MTDMIDVEVPKYGTVVVQQGQVHDVRESIPKEVPCWCTDKRHHPKFRRLQESKPHMIIFQQFEMAWEV